MLRTNPARALAIAAAVCLAFPAAGAEYMIAPLPPDGARTQAHAVNAAGHVAGEWFTTAVSAAFWNGNGGRLLGGLTRPTQYYCYINYATALNDADEVVGNQWFRPCGSFTENDTRAFYWTLAAPSMTEIVPTADFLNTKALGISSAGVVVVTMTGPTGTGPAQRAFRWTKAGGLEPIGTLGGTTSTAVSINRAGHILGQSTIAGDAATHTYLLKHSGELTPDDDFGTLPAPGAQPVDLNDNGQVLFMASVDVGGITMTRGFVATNGRFDRIGSAAIHGNVTPTAINGTGDVVGNAPVNGYQVLAFLYHEGSLRDLNDLLPAGSGWQLQTAEDINDAGQIVGVGELAGVWRGYIMTPLRPGDVSRDGRLDAADAVIMLQAGAGLKAGVSVSLGDVAPAPSTSGTGYGDGRVDVLDAVRTLRFLGGFETPWP